jgi:ABC-type transport system involved in multi-copper enzyme maturation permease subunit
MIWKIAKKEFLLNLMAFKFVVAVVVSIALTAIFTPILAKDYQQRLRAYHDNVARDEAELRKVKVYKNIAPTIFRPPSMLSVFSEGLEKRIGESATIELDKVPEISAAATEGNPYQSVFPVFDASLILKIVIGVLALLVAYDAVSGERERGTLKLMLSGTTRRHQVLLAKLLAGLLILVVPVTIVFVIGMIILLSFPLVDLTVSDWERIGLMYLASLIFVSAMYNVGLLFSCLTRRSAISLVLGLFLWILFAVVIPNGSVYLAAEMRPLKLQETIDGQVMSLRQEYESEFNKVKPPSPNRVWQSDTADAFGRGYLRLVNRAYMEYLQKSMPLEYSLRIKYADRYWEVERSYFNSLCEQKILADSLSKLSPISLYESVMSALAGTDMAAYQRFMDTVRAHRAELIEYIRSKTTDFSSPSFFTPCTQEEAAEYDKFITQLSQLENDAEMARWNQANQALRNWWEKMLIETPNLDLRDCPRFTSAHGAFGNLRSAIGDLALLLFANFLFFVVAFATFERYDVR